MNTIKIVVTETGRNAPGKPSQIFNEEVRHFTTIGEVKEFLIDRYGKLPRARKKIYRDTKDGKTLEVGFLHSFWNKDISHDSKPWFQTDWIAFTEIEERPFNYRQIYK